MATWLVSQGHGKSKIGIWRQAGLGKGHVDGAMGVATKHAGLRVNVYAHQRASTAGGASQPDGQMSHPVDVSQPLNLATLSFCKRPIKQWL